MPTARRIATPRKSARTATSSPVPISPSRTPAARRGRSPSRAPRRRRRSGRRTGRCRCVERVKIHGSRLIATQRTANPSRVVAPSLTCLLRRPAPDWQPVRLATVFPGTDGAGIATGIGAGLRAPSMLRAWSASPRSEPRSRVASGEGSPTPRSASGPTRPRCAATGTPRTWSATCSSGRAAWSARPGIAVPALSGLTDKEMAPAQEAAVREARGAAARPASSRSSRCRRSTRSSTPSSSSCTTRTSGAPSRAGADATCPTSRSTPCGRASRPRAPRWSGRAGVPVVVRRTDTGETATLTSGGDPVELSGPVTGDRVLPVRPRPGARAGLRRSAGAGRRRYAGAEFGF